MKALQWLRTVHNFRSPGFWSKENPKQVASNSELARWIKNQALHINGKPVQADTFIDMDELESAALFPKNAQKRITIV